MNDSRENGGRPMDFHPYALVLIHVLAKKVYKGKVRETFRELTETRRNWRWLRRVVAKTHPHRPDLWLPKKPPRRHHYTYFRDRYLLEEETTARMAELVMASGIALANERGLLQARAGRSLLNPAKADCIAVDGKVISSASRYKPGTPVYDDAGTFLRFRRADTDREYIEGGNDEHVHGHKFVIASARDDGYYNRAVLGVAPAIDGSELDAYLPMLAELTKSLSPLVSIMDGAPHGKHIDLALRQLGVLFLSPVPPKRKPTKKGGKRVERLVLVGDVTGRNFTGSKRTVEVWAYRGHACEKFLTEDGRDVLEPMEQLRLSLNKNRREGFRLYGEYATTDGYVVRLPLYQTAEDKRRNFNRTQWLRPYGMDGDAYANLYPVRPSAESVNRQIEDCLWQKRANVFEFRRVHVDLLGWALADNAISDFVRRRQRAGPTLLVAA